MESVFIVHRDSADGPEADTFSDRELAEEWAEHIGSTVTEEFIIDKAVLEQMKNSYDDND